MKVILTIFLTIASFHSWAEPRLSSETTVCNNLVDLIDSNKSLQEFLLLCEHLVKADPACKNVLPENRTNCYEGQKGNQVFSDADLMAKVGGCMKGVAWDSMVGLGKLGLDLIESYVDMEMNKFKFLTSSDYRSQVIGDMIDSAKKDAETLDKALTKAPETFQQLSEKTKSAKDAVATSITSVTFKPDQHAKIMGDFLQMSGAYFGQEYQKNLMKTYNPVGALGVTLAEPMVKLLAQGLEGVVSYVNPEYSCLNGPAKANTLCKAVGDLLVPPVAVFSFLKGGRTALAALMKSSEKGRASLEASRKNFVNLNHLDGAAALTDSQRIAEAAKLLGRPLNKAQEEAILKAHYVGLNEGRGFGTYSAKDIAEKARILREAGLDPADTRLLMEKGITGTFGSPLAQVAGGASMDAKLLGDQISMAAKRGDDVADKMKKYVDAQKEAGLKYADAAKAAGQPIYLEASMNASMKAGDKAQAIKAIEQGIVDHGFKKEIIVQDLADRIKKLEDATRTNPSDPAVALELKTMKETKLALEGTRTPPPTAIASTQASARAPAVTSAPPSPYQAKELAEKAYRNKDYEGASSYYMQAATKKEFKDANMQKAFSLSVQGNGATGVSMVKEVSKKTGELPDMIETVYKSDMYLPKNQQQKESMLRILREMDSQLQTQTLYNNSPKTQLRDMINRVEAWKP